jgi:hypothetical protein
MLGFLALLVFLIYVLIGSCFKARRASEVGANANQKSSHVDGNTVVATLTVTGSSSRRMRDSPGQV